VNESITFQPNGSKRIDVPITIIDENLIENNERFSVSLSSQSVPMLVVEDPGIAYITIKDDDSKMFCSFLCVKLLFSFCGRYIYIIY
jgi:hypothetical protein